MSDSERENAHPADTAPSPALSALRRACVEALVEIQRAEISAMRAEITMLYELIVTTGTRLAASFQALMAAVGGGEAVHSLPETTTAVMVLQAHDRAAQLAAHLGARAVALTVLEEKREQAVRAGAEELRALLGAARAGAFHCRAWTASHVAPGGIELF